MPSCEVTEVFDLMKYVYVRGACITACVIQRVMYYRWCGFYLRNESGSLGRKIM